jgi:pimeloyl-ACP methyl ester carboxylesterase
MYQARRISRSEIIPIRNLNYHVRVWGEPQPDKPTLVLMHGWMDVAASYQFLVDAFSEAFVNRRHIVAADWRGFGLTTAAPVDNYWFADYLADLDFLLDHYSPDKPVDLVGHSLGGNVVMQYGGVRPARLRRLINLEGFGMPVGRATQAPKRLANWMDELKSINSGALQLKTYDSVEGVAQRLMKTNPRLARDEAGHDRAAWLSYHWAVENKSGGKKGQWEILGDVAHKISGANVSHVEEVLAMYAAITAPTLFVQASDDSMVGWYGTRFTLAEFHERLKSVPNLVSRVIPDSGHMLHHDQPQALAKLIEDFVA